MISSAILSQVSQLKKSWIKSEVYYDYKKVGKK